MPFDWKQLLDVAAELANCAANRPNPEAFHRSAVNRAYFGAFGHAVDYAERFLGYSARESEEDHGRLRQHLRDRKRKNAADRLGYLRQWRNDADYSPELPWDDMRAIVDSAIKQANEVVEILKPPRIRT